MGERKFCSEKILYTQNWNRLGISPRHALHFSFGEDVRNVHICIFQIYVAGLQTLQCVYNIHIWYLLYIPETYTYIEKCNNF